MPINIPKEFGAKRTGAPRKADLTNIMYGKLPPQNKELEEAVLGAIMLEKDKLSDILETLPSPECFYVDANQRIFSAIRRLADTGKPVDILTVSEELKRTEELELVGGHFYITRLTMNIVSSANVVAHAHIIKEKFIERELIRICGQIVADAYEDKTDVFELLDKAETELFEVSNNYLRNNYTNLKDVIVETIQQIEKNRNEKEDITGVTSGYTSLDAITGGWQKSDLIILAARPSVGKTAFALNLAMNAAMSTHKQSAVAIFSLEMSSSQIVKRMLSAVTEIRLENINRGRLEDYEFEQINHRLGKLESAPIFLDDQAGLNIFELRAKCRRLKDKHDIQLVIIDYLQLMHGPTDKGGNREQEISKISRELKALAKELDIPIIALSQLSRAVESRNTKIPMLSDLRESGAIEQDADMVMFIYRPEYHGIEKDEMGETFDGETHINIAKHRNGRLDMVKLKAILEYQKFVEPAGQWVSGGGGAPFEKPNAGIPKNYEDFGNSSLSVSSDFQIKPSKMNNLDWDDDDTNNKNTAPPAPDNDVPF